MEKEHNVFLVEKDMKVNIRTVKGMGKEQNGMKMEIDIKVNLRRVN